MDHLPLPEGGRNIWSYTKAGVDQPVHHMEVPYLDLATYDGKGLEGALSRMGTSEEAILKSMENDYVDDLFIDSCVQQYAFIALIHEFHTILGITNVPKFFRQLDDGKHVVTTRPFVDFTIPEVLAKVIPISREDIVNQLRHCNEQTAADCAKLVWYYGKRVDQSRKDQMNALIKRVGGFMTKIGLHLEAGRAYARRPHAARFRVCVGAWIFLEAMNTLVVAMLDTSSGGVGWGRLYFSNTFAQATRNQRWCPWSTSDIGSSTLSVAYIATLLPAFDENRHESCSVSSCAVSHLQTDPKPSHTSSCAGDCADYSASEDEISRILDTNGTPVVVREPSAVGYRFQMIDALSSKVGYVAISHVWSHGLGNRISNSVPHCQLREIFEMVDSIPGKLNAVWLDTLCVPVTKPYQIHRKIAISLMRSTYEGAKAVLVLDRRLRQTPNEPTMRRYQLLFSDWMHRVWTLQEALLPGLERVYIKLQPPQPVDMTQFTRPYTIHVGTGVGVEDVLQVAIPGKFVLGFPTPSLWEPDRRLHRNTRTLEDLAQAFRSRETTKVRDESICLGILLGLKMDSAQLPTMETIYRETQKIPPALAFTGEPRLDVRSFRALPRTFKLQGGDFHNGRSVHETQPPAWWTPLGLCMVRPAFIFENIQFGLNESRRSAFMATLKDLRGKDSYNCVSRPYMNKSLIRGQLTAVVLESLKPFETPGQNCSGIIATNVLKNADGYYRCNWLSRANLHILEGAKYATIALPNIAAEYIQPTIWCID